MKNQQKNNYDYDLFVIGTGEAGSSAASVCSAFGWRVGIVDDQPYGGTCSIRGCNPKRTLAGAVELVHRVKLMQGKGIKGTISCDWRELIQFKDEMTQGIPLMQERHFKEQGIDMYHGFAFFTGTHELDIEGKKVSSRYILIGSGSKPRSLGIPGEEYIVTSNELFQLREQPSQILFIGAGYISMELSHIIASLGTRVTVLEYAPRPLMKFDRDLVSMLVEESQKLGIDIFVNKGIQKIEKKDSKYLVTTGGEQQQHFEVDLVVHGAGRIPNIDRLQLQNADINHDENHIRVNEFLQSVSNRSVYVAGDAHAEGIELTPVAEIEGKIAAYNMLHNNTKIPDYTAVPSVVFTFPSLASVGDIVDPDIESPFTEVVFRDTSSKHITKRLGLKRSAFKIIADKTTGHILGAHMLGHNVDEVINHFALAIRAKISIEELKEMPFTFPSVTYDTVNRL